MLNRKMLMLGTVMVLLAVLSSTAFAQEERPVVTEKWYTYWGGGLSDFTYPGETNDILNQLSYQDGITRSKIALDILGFYWHIGQKTLGGFVVNGAADRFEASSSDYFQWNHYLYGGSAIHFLGSNFGSGPFIRADVGIAKMVVQDSEGTNEASNSGTGILLGGGWSIDFGGTRILLNANYSVRDIDGDTMKIVGFSLGGLF